MNSLKNTLNRADVKEWLGQTFIYSILIPAGIVFLTSLQGGLNVKAALVAACYAAVSALVNLHGKYSAGATTQTTVVSTQG